VQTKLQDIQDILKAIKAVVEVHKTGQGTLGEVSNADGMVLSDLIVLLYIQLVVGPLFGDHVSHFLGQMASLNEIGCF
jgi:hypothetical protein